MTKYPVFEKRVRSSASGNSRELAVPPELLHLVGYSVYEWINEKGNIEITNQRNGTQHINGLFVRRDIHKHGGSEVIVIHHEIRNMFKILGKELDSVKIFVNEWNNLEIQPISNKP